MLQWSGAARSHHIGLQIFSGGYDKIVTHLDIAISF